MSLAPLTDERMVALARVHARIVTCALRCDTHRLDHLAPILLRQCLAKNTI
jgi:hypothetical protein